MNKKLIYGFAIIAGLASCNDDYTDWSSPQSNPEHEAVEKFTLTVQPAVETIDFATETAESIQLFSTNLESGQTNSFALTLSAEDKAETVVLTAASDGTVVSAELQDAVATIYGKAPVERTLNVKVAADVMITTEDGKIVAKKEADPFSLKITLDAPQISEHYYLIGAPSSWEITDTSLPFSHSGKNVYDDPVFTCTFPVEDGEIWFAITDDITLEKADWAYAFGCAEGNGANGMEGKLKRRSELTDDGSWKVMVDGDAKFIKVTINMMEYSYSIEKLNFAEYIYEVGNNNGWGTGYALQGPNFDGKYYGAMYLVSGFKFRSNVDNWDGSGNWGLNSNNDEGILVNDGMSGNISVPADGHYMIEVNLVDMTYTLTPFTQLGIIGDGQPGGWDSDTPLTYDEMEKCWKATSVQLVAGKSIKFRTVGTWDVVNIGGASLSNLTFNSQDNIPVEKDGTFTVKLYLETQGAPYVTLTEE